MAEAIRRVLASLRADLAAGRTRAGVVHAVLLNRVAAHLAAESRPSLRAVFHLTGTVLHTNLGRAWLPEEAIATLSVAARASTNLEFDLAAGTRGDRDDHVESLLCQLTGAEAATVVNNNAAAKLLGGPQAGIVVGRAALIERMTRNPLKRARRVDKLTIAALAAVLALYRDPERLAERLPVLRVLTRPLADIQALAVRVRPVVTDAVGQLATVDVVSCHSQIGSGALPTRTLPSAGLALRPLAARHAGATLKCIAAAFRSLPVPVIGRVHDGAFVMDLRALEDEEGFRKQLAELVFTDAD